MSWPSSLKVPALLAGLVAAGCGSGAPEDPRLIATDGDLAAAARASAEPLVYRRTRGDIYQVMMKTQPDAAQAPDLFLRQRQEEAVATIRAVCGFVSPDFVSQPEIRADGLVSVFVRCSPGTATKGRPEKSNIRERSRRLKDN